MKSYHCLAVLLGALMAVPQAAAAPVFTPFLSVDVNGYNPAGSQSLGPTAAGFQAWEAAEGSPNPSINWGSSGSLGLTKVFPTLLGNITANMKGVAPNSFLPARDRGTNAGALSDVTRDWVAAQLGVNGFGQTYIRITLSGLNPNNTYEFTGFARDPFNAGADSFQSWTDRASLGGLDGPGPYMNANFGPGSLYQPAPGAANNPIPALSRLRISGTDSADPYAYGVTFRTTADGAGVITVYTWADPDRYSGIQSATLLNGFQIAVVPEPTTLVMFATGFIGLFVVGRRCPRRTRSR